MSSNIEIKKICEYCGNEFMAKTTVTRYCSHKCNSRAYKQALKEKKVNKAIEKTNQQKILSATEIDFDVIKQKEFLSLKEAYKLIGVSERTLYRLIETGKIKSTKIGRRTLIKKAEIDKLFE